MIALATSLVSALSFAPGRPLEPIDVIDDKFGGAIRSLPSFGTAGLYAVIVMAAFTFAIAIASARRPRLLDAARIAAYATCALVVFDLLLLAYAFVTHDFRIRYVARYSDRSMPTAYLFTALWGGQDGSLLWWLFLLSANTTACVLWLKGKYRELQPFVIATLMAIMIFFVVIMTFSANPFSESIAGARINGEGLNPLLQNFYMIIHPPSLYTGFVGCSVPFAFGVAALATGRLGEEWLYAVRRWVLFAWVFLSIGNTLGMLWAYEELGWGGHWAWDPVENAAFMPWLTASAFVHSIMVQERRSMLKVWNIVLLSMTFFMTIWGTFLTRSGMIASVHAFAQSNIGIYFTYFMVTIASVVTALIAYRLPELKSVDPRGSEVAIARYRSEVGGNVIKVLVAETLTLIAIRMTTEKMTWVGLLAVAVVIGLIIYGLVSMARYFPAARAPGIDAVFSREAAFVANNWILLAMQVFVCLTTAWPLISEAVTGEKVTVGPAFYNRWMVPLGLMLFGLMGVGPLLGWRKTSDSSLRKAFRIPLAALFSMMALHLLIGRAIGFPAIVESDPIYPGLLGLVHQKIGAVVPMLAIGLASFNIAVIVQEYLRGIGARRRAHEGEGFFTALKELVARSRRRYGGYIVHAGVVVMFLGFTGGAYKFDQEVAVHPGESFQFKDYEVTYLGTRMEPTPEKRELYIDLRVKWRGKDLGIKSPAHFIYAQQGMTTSEVSITPGLRDDLYIAPGTVNPETKLATLHLYSNPLESWIWLGAMILILGAAISTWPEAALGEVGVGAYLRTAGATVTSLAFGLLLALTPARVKADPMQMSGNSSSMAGNVEMKSDAERKLFSNLLCMCGGCDRLPLSTCTCDWAAGMRAELSERLSSGASIDSITDDYVKRYGAASLNVPPSKGFNISLWAVPTGLIALGGVGAFFLVRKWTRAGKANGKPKATPGGAGPGKDDYDEKLDEELRSLDG